MLKEALKNNYDTDFICTIEEVEKRVKGKIPKKNKEKKRNETYRESQSRCTSRLVYLTPCEIRYWAMSG